MRNYFPITLTPWNEYMNRNTILPPHMAQKLNYILFKIHNYIPFTLNFFF